MMTKGTKMKERPFSPEKVKLFVYTTEKEIFKFVSEIGDKSNNFRLGKSKNTEKASEIHKKI